MKKIKSFVLVAVLLPAFVVLALIGCNKKFDKLLTTHSDTASYVVQQPKVLYLIVDGAVGTEIQNINPFALNQLSKNAVYSWNALADYNSFVDPVYTDAEGWANMMTGVTRPKHQVADNTFSGNNLVAYPSFIKMIKRDADYKAKFIAAFSASPNFNSYFSDSADIHTALPTDDDVKKAVISVLDTCSKVDVVVGQFHAVEAAGAAKGYQSSVPEYNAAVVHIDSSIQSIMTALKSRPTYSKEKWLVVLASNKGTDTATWKTADTKFQDSRRNSFIFFYAPNYGSTYVGTPTLSSLQYTGSTPLYTRSLNSIATLSNGNGFDFTRSKGDFTIELKIKTVPGHGGIWPAILSKKWNQNTTTPVATADTSKGWSINMTTNSYNSWEFRAKGSGGLVTTGGNASYGASKNKIVITDGIWHTITAVIYTRSLDNKRCVRTFTDGIFENEMDITIAEDGLNSAAPLKIGFLKDLNAGTSSNDDKYSVSGVKIFNAALPDAIVAQYFKKTGVVNHPYLNSLMGFWTCLDGKGTILTDDAFGNNFSTTGTSWTFFNDMDPMRLQPDVNNSTYRQVPNSVDIPYMILSWLNTKKPAWDMDGYPWTPSTFVAY